MRDIKVTGNMFYYEINLIDKEIDYKDKLYVIKGFFDELRVEWAMHRIKNRWAIARRANKLPDKDQWEK